METEEERAKNRAMYAEIQKNWREQFTPMPPPPPKTLEEKLEREREEEDMAKNRAMYAQIQKNLREQLGWHPEEE